MLVPLGDLVDRLSIAVRKRRIQPGSISEDEINDVLDSMIEIIDTLDDDKKKRFLYDLAKLCELNNAIWHLEFIVRTADETLLSDEEVGKRSRLIRPLNMKRTAIRSDMNEYSKTGYRIVNV